MKKKDVIIILILTLFAIAGGSAAGFMIYKRSKPVQSESKSSLVKERKTTVDSTEKKVDEPSSPTSTPVTTENMIGEGIITLKENPVTVKVGERYDANENVLSVTDPEGKEYVKVSGEIDYSNPDRPKLPHIDNEQYYVINADVDTSEPGTQSVDVIAIDKYTQFTIKSFKVNIIE